jgi:hypothetical protein
MTQLPPEQQHAIQAMAWTEEDVAGLAQTLATFRESLPSRQREAFDAMLALAGEAAGGDVQGYVTGKGSGTFHGRRGICFGSSVQPEVIGAIITSFGNLVRGIV